MITIYAVFALIAIISIISIVFYVIITFIIMFHIEQRRKNARDNTTIYIGDLNDEGYQSLQMLVDCERCVDLTKKGE